MKLSFAFPFSLGATMVMLSLLAIGLLMVLRWLGKRKLTMTYAVVWVMVFLAAAVLVAVPPFLSVLSQLLFTASVDGTLRLLAFVGVFGFLVFFSVKISVLTNANEELAQRVALLEYSLKEKIQKLTKEK